MGPLKSSFFVLGFAVSILGNAAPARAGTQYTLNMGGSYEQPVYISLTGFQNGAVVASTGGDIHDSSFGANNSPAAAIIMYCVDIPHDVGVPQTFNTLTYKANPVAPNDYNTWNHSGTILNDASTLNVGGVLANGGQISWLMDTYARAIHADIVSNANVGTINGVTFLGTASDASLALNAALWKEVYGSAFTLSTTQNNTNLVTDYNRIMASVQTAPVSDTYWFNLPDAQQGQVGLLVAAVPEPSTFVVWSMMAGVFGAGWIRKRMRQPVLAG